MTVFYDKDGHEIDLWHYEHMFNDYRYRVLAANRTREMVIVRTEWMGYDPDGYIPPRLFRTMIQGGSLAGHEVWTNTPAEAMVEHKKLLELVSDAHTFTWRALAAFVLLAGFVGLLVLLTASIP